MRTYWICFSDAVNGNYQELTITDIKVSGDDMINSEFSLCGKEPISFKIIQVPGGLNPEILVNWIRLIDPDIVHHQGHERKKIYDRQNL